MDEEDIFKWQLDYGSSSSSQPRVFETKFGGGVVQVIPDGLNPVDTSYNVQIDATNAQAAEIVAFLTAHVGNPFHWAGPGVPHVLPTAAGRAAYLAKLFRVRATRWRENWQSFEYKRVTATFRVFI